MKKLSSIIWGIVLISAGVLFALNAFNVVDVFFDGWWTLFIIIPSAIGLFTERKKTGNLIGIAIGVCLLLWCQDIIEIDIVLKLIVPTIIIVVGAKMIFGGLFDKKANEISAEMKESGAEPKVGCAIFSGYNMNFDGEIFDGAELNAIFGGVKCDLRNAIIEKDCVIKTSAIFGGIDILVPENINVKTNTTAIFGGVSNKTASKNNVPTIYVTGTCMFGGTDIK